VDKQAPLAPLSVDRVITTVDQTRGVLHVSVRNNDRERERMVIYAETMPWLVELYMHTLEVRVDGVKDRECDYLPLFRFDFRLFIWFPIRFFSVGVIFMLCYGQGRSWNARTSSVDAWTFRMVILPRLHTFAKTALAAGLLEDTLTYRRSGYIGHV
jgi:hypothetical protein